MHVLDPVVLGAHQRRRRSATAGGCAPPSGSTPRKARSSSSQSSWPSSSVDVPRRRSRADVPVATGSPGSARARSFARNHQRHAGADDAVAEHEVVRVEVPHPLVRAQSVARREHRRQHQLEHRAQPQALGQPPRGFGPVRHRGDHERADAVAPDLDRVPVRGEGLAHPAQRGELLVAHAPEHLLHFSRQLVEAPDRADPGPPGTSAAAPGPPRPAPPRRGRRRCRCGSRSSCRSRRIPLLLAPAGPSPAAWRPCQCDRFCLGRQLPRTLARTSPSGRPRRACA